MRVVVGRLKSDYRYGGDTGYNTFVWLECAQGACDNVAVLSQEILGLRETYHVQGHNLARLYDPKLMPRSLRTAHHAVVEAAEVDCN